MFFFVVLLTIQAATSQTVTSLDCSVFTSDKQIIQSLPVLMVINSFAPENYPNTARVTTQGRVIELNLSNMRDFSTSIYCLSSLRSLTIQNSTALTIPDGISRLALTLTTLKLTNTKLAQPLPRDLFELIILETLTFDTCGLESLPEEIGQLRSLSYLTASGNQLSSLPSSLRQLSSLISLTVSGNPLLSSLDALSGRSYLRELRASACSIDHLPANLSGLKVLELNRNQLTSLDNLNTIKFNDCQSLRLDYNRITNIPSSISAVISVEDLDLSHNLLTDLPEEFYRIPILQTLNLLNNQFSDKEVNWIRGRFRLTNTTLYIETPVF